LLDLNYTEPVFRPPSEWRSLILQVTNGCSWNHCTFCEMYQGAQKAFSFKEIEQLRTELKSASQSGAPIQRIFLADGDALTLSTRRLIEILDAINEYFPNIQRISSYCLPRNLINKTVEELIELYRRGLKLVYVGCETGDNELLRLVNKGETHQTSLSALNKLHQANIKSSVMILNGLGGTVLSEQHAKASAELMNASQPNYVSTLVVSFPKGEQRFRANFPNYQPLSQQQLFSELRTFIEHLDLRSTIYRSDHASNYLALKGVLNKDKSRLLNTLTTAIESPDSVILRPESMRGL